MCTDGIFDSLDDLVHYLSIHKCSLTLKMPRKPAS